MKKIHLVATRLVGISLLLAGVITACVPPGTTSPTSLPSQDLTSAIPPTDLPVETGTVTLTNTPLPSLGVDSASLAGMNIQVWHAFAGDAYRLFIQQVELFNATNEWGFTVTPSGYGDHLTLFEAMQAAVAEGALPQMVVTLPEQGLVWQAQGLVVDLAPYLNDPEYGLTSAEIADFPAAFWSGVGAPAQRSGRFLYYNQTWAHELGFTSAPLTPEEFRQQTCAANAAFRSDPDPTDDGYGGMVLDDNWQTVHSWLLAFGGSPVQADEGSYAFNTAENQDALAYLKGLYDDNCAWLLLDDAPYAAFAQRKALFISADLAEVPAARLAMTAAENEDEWRLVPFPGIENPVIVAYGPSYIPLSHSPEEGLAAWLFTRWMLSAENQAQWVEMTGLLPLRLSVLDMIAPYRSASPEWDSAVSALDFTQAVPELASWREVRYLLSDGMQRIFQVNLPVEQIPALLEEMQSMALELSGE